MRLIPFGVAVVAAALYFVNLGEPPFIEPPEGFHVVVARGMIDSGDSITPRLDGVRYFDKPPLLYWLMSATFSLDGITPFSARFWPAVAAVGCAAVTAHVGVMLGGPRVGLIAGLIVAANLGMFVYGRLVKPDVPFIFCIMLAYAGFTAAYLGRHPRWGLTLLWGGLGLAALAKDPLGALAPLLVIGLLFRLTRERPLAPWWPWWAVVLFVALALPWYVAVEARNPGFVWYTIVDNHVLNFLHRRIFPDEDVPLGNVEFLAITVAMFLPWSLSAPSAIARALRRPWERPADRVLAVFALWAVLVIGFFTLSAFKLPHYGLPAIPALALVVASTWDRTIGGEPGGIEPRVLVLSMALLFAVAGVVLAAVWAGVLGIPREALTAVEMTARNMAARGQVAVNRPLEAFRPMLASSAVIFSVAAVVLAVAAWWRSAQLGVTVALAAMLAFLPSAARGMAEFARGRSAGPIVEALVHRAQPGDTIVHEGPLENSASMLLAVPPPVHVVNGSLSNLAFGATFPEAADIFWDLARLRDRWTAAGRTFLVSVVNGERSVVRSLPPGRVHLIADANGRRLYSNVADARPGAP